MVWYLRILSVALFGFGLAVSVTCWQGAADDTEYFRALKAVEKHPGHVLYTTELKMIEPRHMLLLGGAYSAAPIGLVVGSICLGIASVLARVNER